MESTVDKHFAHFCLAYECGKQPNYGDYLDDVGTENRAALDAKIEYYLLEDAPVRRWDAERFDEDLDRPVMHRVAELYRLMARDLETELHDD